MTQVLSFDAVQTVRFIQVLAGGGPLTFQTFSDRDELKVKRVGLKDYDPNAGWKHGTLESLKTYLERLNAKGAGVYAMVNQGDGKGRAAINVVRVRALFIDTDGAPFPADLPIRPHLIVESSPGRWHLYWLVDGVRLDDFGLFQEVLAERYGTDKSVKDLPRVLRLPGTYHRKAEPIMARLLDANDYRPHTVAEIVKAWPSLLERLEQKTRRSAEHERQREAILVRAAESRSNRAFAANTQQRAERMLQTHHDTIAGAGEGARHSTLLRSARALGGYVSTGLLGRAEVENTLIVAAQACGLPDGEAKDAISWGLDKGVEAPLELPADKPQLFSAKPTFGAAQGAPILSRPSQLKPGSGQPGSRTEALPGEPNLDGKPCR